MTEAHAALHRRLPELCAETLFAGTETLDGFALAGCSACARAVVNARDVAVDLAQTTARAAPPAELRARVLASIGHPEARANPRARDDGKTRDPSAALALLHARAALEAPRIAELDRLADRLVAIAPLAESLLESLAKQTGFAIHFVSVVREGRVYALAQRGLPEAFAGYRDIRRDASFCTHTVSADEPFVVEDAAREPFFRGSKMVLRFGICAYVGAPVRSSRGIPLGTVCALDFTPRHISPDLVRLVSAHADEVASLLASGVPGLASS